MYRSQITYLNVSGILLFILSGSITYAIYCKGVDIMKNLSLLANSWDTEKYYELKKVLEKKRIDPNLLDEVIEDRLKFERANFILYTSKH